MSGTNGSNMPVGRTTTSLTGKTHDAAIERRGTVGAAEAESTVRALFTVALAKPRETVESEAALLTLCKDYEWADECFYRLPRGRKEVTGLTVRFAEEALRLFRNFHASNVVIAEDDRSRTVRVRLIDLEEVRVYESEFIVDKTVERKFLKDGQRSLGQRLNSEGEVVHLVDATEADMYQKTAILVSKALRDMLLRMMPLKFKLACEREIVASIKAGPSGMTRDEIVRSMVQVYMDMGVQARDLEAYLGHPLEQFTDDERLSLRGLAKAIQDGQTSWPDALRERLEKTGRKEPSKASADLGSMRAGKKDAHQGHDEAATAMSEATKAAGPREAPLAPSQASNAGPAVPKTFADEVVENVGKVLEFPDDDIPFDDGPTEAAVESEAAKAAKIKADTIAEIASTLKSIDYDMDVVPGFAEHLGLENKAVEDYGQIELNRVFDAVVNEKRNILERARKEELAAKERAKSKGVIDKILEKRELIRASVKPNPFPTDARWISKINAKMFPDKFTGDLDACDDKVLGKILAEHDKLLRSVGASA